MKRPNEDKDRESRIIDEIVVDAYDEQERAMSWYYYAADKIAFPFKACCATKRASSPLKIGDMVEVESMASEDDCMHELMVLITSKNESLAVPLVQLKPSPASTDLTRQVVTDWQYWVARGYRF